MRSFRYTNSTTLGDTDYRLRFQEVSMQIRRMIIVQSAFANNNQNYHSHDV